VRARAALRGAFARAAKGVDVAVLGNILSDQARPASALLEILCAATERLADVPGAAKDATNSVLAWNSVDMGHGEGAETRYRLAAPLSALAAAKVSWAVDRMTALAADTEPMVRTRAIEALALRPADAWARDLFVGALLDPEPRVREAAADALARIPEDVRAPTLAALGGALLHEPWTFVRAAAASALAARPPSSPVDKMLGAALADRAPRVRAAAASALGEHRAGAFVGPLLARLGDVREDPFVRTSAARALGAMCTPAWDAVPVLTLLAARAASPAAGEAEHDVGIAAIAALGELAPKDLHERLGPLREPSVPPDVRLTAVQAERAPGRRCP
jgi:HEAT repeat protein